MQLFNRTKKNTTLAPEVQAFAQAERRERMGMAWLVGVVSLVVTVLVAMALFYGGRWVYRSIANRGDKATPVVTEQTSDDNQSSSNNSSSSNSSNNGSNSSTSTQTPANPAPASTPNTSAPAQQPVTGDDTTTLPNTGPDVDL